MHFFNLFVLVILFLFIFCTDAEYKIALDTSGIAPAGNISTLAFSITDAKNQSLTWAELKVGNERKLHVIIVGKDLDIIGHVHPEDFTFQHSNTSTQFITQFIFPKGGMYAIGCEFVSLEDESFQQSFIVNITGFPQMSSQVVLDWSTTQTFKFFDMNSSQALVQPIFISNSKLNTSVSNEIGIIASSVFNRGYPLYAGKCHLLYFNLRNSSNNMPVNNLVKYLGQPMHLIAAHSNLDFLYHFHGFIMQGSMSMSTLSCNDEAMMVTDPPYGPDIYATFRFPKSGLYRLFAQSRTENKLIIHAYHIYVHEPISNEWLYILGFVFVIASLLGICIIASICTTLKIVRVVKAKTQAKAKGFQKV